MKITEYDYAVGQGWNSVKDNPNGWTDGTVKTPHGMVDVYAQGDDKHRHVTQLIFQSRGRVYVRTFEKRYTHRGIARKAKELAREITEQQD